MDAVGSPAESPANLDAATAGSFARTVLAVLDTPWPYGAAHMSSGPDDCDVTPTRLHPSFHGSLDWHSSCHMQWSALTLLDSGLLDEATASRLVDTLDARLTPENVAVEAAYLRKHPGFERPYGWAWLAVLHARALASRHPGAARWAGALQPAADVVADLFLGWLPRQALPVRHGVHTNSAFALTLLRAACAATGRGEVVRALEARAREWFGEDAALPVGYEPSGTDFLSPSLCEADLMGAVLGQGFGVWLTAALPGLGTDADPLLQLPPVLDPTDGHLVHLYGLGLSRAWQLRRLVANAPAIAPDVREIVRDAARNQEAWAAEAVVTGDFMSTHWLVSYALLAKGFPLVPNATA